MLRPCTLKEGGRVNRKVDSRLHGKGNSHPPWRKAGQPSYLVDVVDSDQEVFNKELSLFMRRQGRAAPTPRRAGLRGSAAMRPERGRTSWRGGARRLPRQSLRRGRQKSISPQRQWLSEVETAARCSFELVYPLQHSSVVWLSSTYQKGAPVCPRFRFWLRYRAGMHVHAQPV